MSPQPKHFFLALQLMEFLFLILVPACQAATPTGLLPTINQHVTTHPPTTTAIVTQTLSEASITSSITPPETTQLISRVEVQIAAQVGGEVTDIEINGTYAYLSVGPRLVVMDLSNPNMLQVATMSDLLPGLGKALAI